MHQDGGRFRSLVGDAGLGSVLRGRRGAMGLRVERNPLNVGGHSFCWTRRDSAGGSAVSVSRPDWREDSVSLCSEGAVDCRHLLEALHPRNGRRTCAT